MILDLLTQISSSIANTEVKKMKESDPKKYDQTLKLFINLGELALLFLKESPDFRKVFAEIHSEFLNYPESKETIMKAIQASKNISSD